MNKIKAIHFILALIFAASICHASPALMANKSMSKAEMRANVRHTLESIMYILKADQSIHNINHKIEYLKSNYEEELVNEDVSIYLEVLFQDKKNYELASKFLRQISNAYPQGCKQMMENLEWEILYLDAQVRLNFAWAAVNMQSKQMSYILSALPVINGWSHDSIIEALNILRALMDKELSDEDRKTAETTYNILNQMNYKKFRNSKQCQFKLLTEQEEPKKSQQPVFHFED